MRLLASLSPLALHENVAIVVEVQKLVEVSHFFSLHILLSVSWFLLHTKVRALVEVVPSQFDKIMKILACVFIGKNNPFCYELLSSLLLGCNGFNCIFYSFCVFFLCPSLLSFPFFWFSNSLAFLFFSFSIIFLSLSFADFSLFEQ